MRNVHCSIVAYLRAIDQQHTLTCTALHTQFEPLLNHWQSLHTRYLMTTSHKTFGDDFTRQLMTTWDLTVYLLLSNYVS